MLETIVASAATFWLLTLIAVGMLIVASASESFWIAFWTTVIGLLGFQFITTVDPFGYMRANPSHVGLAAIAYLPIGIGLSFFWWWAKLQAAGAVITAGKQEWLRGQRGASPEALASNWASHVRRSLPQAAYNKELIATWIGYWPFSLLVYVAKDFVYEAATWIYDQISGVYQRMADRVMAALIAQPPTQE